jgi:hypothetical protein
VRNTPFEQGPHPHFFCVNTAALPFGQGKHPHSTKSKKVYTLRPFLNNHTKSQPFYTTFMSTSSNDVGILPVTMDSKILFPYAYCP